MFPPPPLSRAFRSSVSFSIIYCPLLHYVQMMFFKLFENAAQQEADKVLAAQAQWGKREEERQRDIDSGGKENLS